AGMHEISLAYAGTPIQRAGEMVTLVSIVVAVALFVSGRRDVRAFEDSRIGTDVQGTGDRLVGARHAVPDAALTPGPSPSGRGEKAEVRNNSLDQLSPRLALALGI